MKTARHNRGRADNLSLLRVSCGRVAKISTSTSVDSTEDAMAGRRTKGFVKRGPRDVQCQKMAGVELQPTHRCCWAGEMHRARQRAPSGRWWPSQPNPTLHHHRRGTNQREGHMVARRNQPVSVQQQQRVCAASLPAFPAITTPQLRRELYLLCRALPSNSSATTTSGVVRERAYHPNSSAQTRRQKPASRM